MDARSPRNGRVIEELGTYDPMVPLTDARAILNGERIAHWVSVGAQPTPKVGTLIKKYGKDGTHLEAQAKRSHNFPNAARNQSRAQRKLPHRLRCRNQKHLLKRRPLKKQQPLKAMQKQKQKQPKRKMHLLPMPRTQKKLLPLKRKADAKEEAKEEPAEAKAEAKEAPAEETKKEESAE